MTTEQYTCLRCGWTWQGRQKRRDHQQPAACPNCGHRKWHEAEPVSRLNERLQNVKIISEGD